MQIDIGLTFCDVSANLKIFTSLKVYGKPRISETVCEMGPKTVDKTAQVRSSADQGVFQTPQT